MDTSSHNLGSSSSEEVFRPYIDRSLIPDPVIVRCGRPVTLTLTIRANPTPSVSWYIGPRLVSASQSDEYQTTSVPAKQQPPASSASVAAAVALAPTAAAADEDGDNPDRFLHRFSLRVSRASRELDRGIFVRASNASGDDCCFLSVRTYEVLEGRSKSYVDLLQSNESKEGERKRLKFYRKISFGSLEDQIRWTRMMEERNGMRSVDDILNPRRSADNSSPGGLHSQDPSDNMEGKRPRHHQSPRADFDTEVIFENVCLPSPLLSYRSTGRRRTLPGASPLTPCRSPWDKPLKKTETSQSGFVSPGNGSCRQEVGFSGRRELMSDIDTRFRGMIDEPSGEHFVEPDARGATTSPSDVINHDALISNGRRRTHANRSDAEGSDILSTAIGCCEDAKAQTNANANAAAGDCRDADAAGHLSRRTTSVESTNSQSSQRLLLVTDLDAFEDDPLPPASSSIDVHSTPCSSSSSSRRGSNSSNVGQQQLSSTPAAAEVLWQLSGRKLSNICQTLITDCGRFADGVPMAPAIDDASASAAAAVVDQTRCQHRPQTTLADDGHGYPEFPTGNSKPSTRSNTSRSLLADSGLASGGSRIGQSNSNDKGSRFMETEISTDLLHHSPRIDADGHQFDTGIDAYTVDLTKHSSEWSFGIQSIPASPLRFAPRDKSSVAPLTDALTTGHSAPGAGKVSLETAIDSDDEVGAENKGFDDKEDVKGVGRREANNSVVSRSAGRRGRTMERGKYDAGLLKDFIKPEFKKFSLPPSSQDLDLDTELAIWELSDFVPDRHQSAPPADATMQIAKSDDLLLRSRQASVSPLRTRISGQGLSPRWIRGTKSVELLTSRNASPGGSRIRRRTLSKEWQIVTLTTREEITTTIRPKFALSTESKSSPNSITSFGSDQGAQNLRTLSDGNQFKLGASSARSTVSDVERNMEERNIQVATWNAETNDRTRVETEIRSPSQLDNAMRTGIVESAIDSQALLATMNAKQQDNGDTAHTGFEDRTQTNGETQPSAAQLQSTDTASTFSLSVPHKTGVDAKGLTVSDELSSSALSSSGITEQPEQVVLDSSSSEQNPDEVAFWAIISEALSEMMKEVQLAESANATTTEDTTSAATKNDTQDTKELEQGQNSTAASDFPESDSLQIVEASDTENVFITDRLENCETPDPLGVDIDALVQALLYFANEGAIGESVKMSGTQAAAENALSHSKESTHEVVTTLNESLPPASSWPQDPLNETSNTTGSKFNPTDSDEAILETCCSGSSFPRRTDACDVLVGCDEEDKNSAANLLFPKRTESTGMVAVCDDEFSVQNVDAESFLEIREESDVLDSSEQAQLHSSLSASETCEKVTPESTNHSENSACSDDTVRRRTVSKQDGAPEVTSMRRRSDSGSADLFPEKAFFEGLFSSLGTIIFLLLAALIFHVFSRIVEHEL